MLHYINRLRYPIAYRQFKAIKFQVEINNEKVKMATEIQQHGHILLSGIITT